MWPWWIDHYVMLVSDRWALVCSAVHGTDISLMVYLTVILTKITSCLANYVLCVTILAGGTRWSKCSSNIIWCEKRQHLQFLVGPASNVLTYVPYPCDLVQSEVSRCIVSLFSLCIIVACCIDDSRNCLHIFGCRFCKCFL